jgi:hypothetical protein
MARYTGPMTRKSRRLKVDLVGGDQAFERRPYPPGQHGVPEAGLLLLLRLQEVLGLLDPDPAVLAGRVGTTLERLVAADEVDLEPAGLAGHGSGVTSHICDTP